jgi:hypothetical protein
LLPGRMAVAFDCVLSWEGSPPESVYRPRTPSMPVGSAGFPMTPRPVTVVLTGMLTGCPTKVFVVNCSTGPHMNGVKSPYSTVHCDRTHVDPLGHNVHADPQAVLSLVASTQTSPPHIPKPVLHTTWQVLAAVHWSVAFVDAPHSAHAPPQQIPPAPHAVPSGAELVGVQIASPVLHDVVPIAQGLPPRTHGVLAVQALQAPSRQKPPAVHAVPLTTLPWTMHVGDPREHDLTPVWHALPSGMHDPPSGHAMHAPSLQI